MRKILALGVLGAASFLIPAPSAQAGQPVINDGPSYPAATGRLDHIAFSCVGLKEMRENLKSRDLKYDERVLPRLNMTQLFYPDPDGISVECNFPPEETEQRTGQGY